MQVSVLCSHLQHVKILKNALSNYCRVFYTYTDFEHFWSETQKGGTPLYLVDVERACEGEHSLTDHPAYRAGQMNIIFYHTPRTLPLMSSAYRIHALGDVDLEADDLSQRLSSIMDAFSIRREKERENEQLKAKLYKSEQRFHKAVEQFQQESQRFDYHQLLVQFIRKIEHKYDGHNFLTAFSAVMEEVDFIDEYAFYELNDSGQKLVSPRIQGKKSYRFPSLWLGMNHGTHGIHEYVQGLAHQTATDCFQGQVVSLAPRISSGALPLVLVYLVVDTHVYQQLDWSLLESFLGGIYASSGKNKTEQTRQFSRFMNQWEFGDLLVDQEGHQDDQGKVLILDFERLLTVVNKEEGEDCFRWQRFCQEFMGLLEGDRRYDYSATFLGRWGMAFLVFEEDYRGLKAWLWELSQKFAYWKFFEDPDSILAQNLIPHLRTCTALRTDFFTYVAKRDGQEAHRYLNLSLTSPPPPPRSSQDSVRREGQEIEV